MWETMFDRTRKKQDATDGDAATGISFTKTNVTFALFQQLSVFSRWWALAEHRQPIGLAARFLFGFGVSKAPGPTRFANFPSQVAFPILGKVFELVLKTLGPQLPMDEGNSLRQCHFRQKCHDASCGRGPCLTAGLNKTPYWLAQFALYMVILELISHCSHKVWHASCQLCRQVCASCISSSPQSSCESAMLMVSLFSTERCSEHHG